MRLSRILWFALTAALAVSCIRSTPLEPVVTVGMESTFTLGVGQEAIISGSPLRLRFVGVVEDSRCGVDVMCFWAGDAKVHLAFSETPGVVERLDLHTTLDPRSAIVRGYRLVLETLEPAPRSGRTIFPDQYRAQLRLTRAP